MWRVWVCDEGVGFRGSGAVARIRIGTSVLAGHFFVGLKVAPKFCYAAVGIVVFHVHCQAVQLSWWRHGCLGERERVLVAIRCWWKDEWPCADQLPEERSPSRKKCTTSNGAEIVYSKIEGTIGVRRAVIVARLDGEGDVRK
jgi:hypothetical protein